MASGHVNRANGGRTRGRTDQCCRRQESPCQLGAVHTWPNSAPAKSPPNVRFWEALPKRRRRACIKSAGCHTGTAAHAKR